MKKVAVYVRESRDDNEINVETILTQRDLLIDFVKKNNYGKIISVYLDDNVSGAIFERKGLNELKEDVNRKNIDVLVLKDLSRLGRSNAKTLLFLEYLEENNVRIITFDGRYDSEKDNDTVGIDTWYNERYIKDISKKIRASLQFKIQKGEFIGKAPFGYKKIDGSKYRLFIDKEAGNIIKKIFLLYKEGYGYKYIADYLNNKNCISPGAKYNKNSVWSNVAVKRILDNQVYVGDSVQGVSEKISFKSKKTRRLPKSNWVITPNTHEGIIQREEFLEVQKIRENKRTVNESHKGKIHLFKSIIFCGSCGSTMIARKKNNRILGYVCSNYHRNGKKVCNSHHVREKIIEEVIYDDLMVLINKNCKNSELINYINNEVGCIDYIEEKKRLDLEVSSLEISMDKIYMDKIHNKISEGMYLRVTKGLYEKIKNKKTKISSIETKINEFKNFQSPIERGVEILKKNGLTNELVKTIVKRIIVRTKEDLLKKEDNNISTYDEKHKKTIEVEILFRL